MKVYIGIDWSERQHDATFLNEAGAVITHLTFPHTPPGFLQFDAARQRLRLPPAACVVGLETAHTLLIDFLWERGYSTLYVIPPNVVHSSRGRYRQSAARSDLSDSFIIADYLRTTPQPLYLWAPDSLLTRQIRAQVNALLALRQAIQRHANRLRSLLLRYHPAPLSLFSTLTSRTALHFIRRFPDPHEMPDRETFLAFARRHRYPNPSRLLKRFTALPQTCPRPAPETTEVYRWEATSLASLLLVLLNQEKAGMRRLETLFTQHPDAFIFASLPGAGPFLAPALLALFGDDRRRFPTPAAVQGLAGTAPVTIQSGKRKEVRFRKACNRNFRRIVQQWAMASISQSVWAQTYFEGLLARHMSPSQACRCLGNQWLAIVWRLWQNRQAYDEEYHLKRWIERQKPRR